MTEQAIKKRLVRAKCRTYHNLSGTFKVIIPTPEPTHFFCPKINTFFRVEVDGLSDKTKRDLTDFKQHCSSDITIQVQIYKKNEQKPAELVEI